MAYTDRSDVIDRVHDALLRARRGRTTPHQLHRELGEEPQAVHYALQVLRRRGRAQSLGCGFWKAAKPNGIHTGGRSEVA